MTGPARGSTIRFDFATAQRIVFGAGAVAQAAPIARSLGSRALLVTGGTAARAEPLRDAVGKAGVDAVVYPVAGEPTVEIVRSGRDLALAEGCDLVIGFGGGSVLDTAKALAAMLTNEGDLLDYLEIIGGGRSLAVPSTPSIAIPTTAGTGSEVTRNSVIASPEHRVKVSLRNTFLLPTIALVDPELTYSVPPALTATTGLDTLTQLIEPLVCTQANPLTDALCREGIGRAARALPLAARDGTDTGAREDMACASLFGGVALANAGLGAVHGITGPLGGMFTIPHGAACAALLPHVVSANIQALRERAPDSRALDRYQVVAGLLTGQAQATPEEAVSWLTALNAELDIPGLSGYGITREHIPEIVEKAAAASSMKVNPIALTQRELARVVEAAL